MKKTDKKNAAPSKNEKKSSKKIIIGVVSALVIFLALLSAIIFIPSNKFTVVFYKIDDAQRKGISEAITSLAAEKKISVSFLQYDSEKSLKEQLPLTSKPSLVITKSGFAVKDAVEKASSLAGIESDVSQGMTSSMRNAIMQKEGKIAALPILSSHIETDIDLMEFRESSTKQINTWKDVEKFIREQKRKKEAPVIFAGGNPDFFLDFMGAFAESLDGVDSYKDCTKILSENEKNFNAVRVAKKLCDEPDSPLATSLKLLKSWYKQGLIHQGVFSFQANDVEAFAASRLASVTFMSLESHRTIAPKTISRFTSVYFPSEHGANSRIFTGNTYYAVPMKKSAKANEILTGLLSVKVQEDMSRSTGIAPVLAQCHTPDKQADDARFWIAATNSPLPGLSNEIYLTKSQKSSLAAEIASRIRN